MYTHYKGYVQTNTGDPEEFYFEVPVDGDENDINEAAIEAMWGSGVVDMWWEECEEDG